MIEFFFTTARYKLLQPKNIPNFPRFVNTSAFSTTPGSYYHNLPPIGFRKSSPIHYSQRVRYQKTEEDHRGFNLVPF